jgi:hypothetical protein
MKEWYIIPYEESSIGIRSFDIWDGEVMSVVFSTHSGENVSFNYAYILSYDDACVTRLWQHAMSEFTWQGV